MDKKFQFKKDENKKGLSTVVITLLLILLSMVAIGIVWAFVSNMINSQIKSSESCFGNYDKVKINGQYTCYEQIDNTHYNLRFSLGVGDVDVDSVIVSIASASAIKSYEIKNTPQIIENLSMYPSGEVGAVLPGKNGGLTYNATGFSAVIDSITISPVINGNSCGVSDSISDISSCEL